MGTEGSGRLAETLEIELMVLDDLLETPGITVFSGIYCVYIAIHLLKITTAAIK